MSVVDLTLWILPLPTATFSLFAIALIKTFGVWGVFHDGRTYTVMKTMQGTHQGTHLPLPRYFFPNSLFSYASHTQVNGHGLYSQQTLNSKASCPSALSPCDAPFLLPGLNSRMRLICPQLILSRWGLFYCLYSLAIFFPNHILSGSLKILQFTLFIPIPRI